MRFALCLLGLMICVAVAVDRAMAQVEQSYSFFALPTLGGPSSFGYGINDQGHVVGSAFLAGNVFHATLWIEGQPTDLGTLGGTDSSARGINSSVWVTGRSNPPGGGGFNRRGFVWRDGRMEDLGSLGGDRVEAHGVNEVGEIVGWSERISGQRLPQDAFMWRQGQMSYLGALDPNRDSHAWSLNNNGLIVGESGSNTWGGWRAVLWDSEIIDLGTLRTGNQGQSTALGVNNIGQIVGYSEVDGTFDWYPFHWENGSMRNLGVVSGTFGGIALAINNSGEAVGAGWTGQRRNVGVLWEPGQPNRRLDDLLPPNCPWRTHFAWDINDAGQISGTGYPAADPETSIAFLMSPVHPTLNLLGPHPGRAGERNGLRITGAPPGSTVHFVYGTIGGGTIIPGCTIQQNALQIQDVTLIASTRADPNGRATIVINVPPIAQGREVLLQAVIVADCAISQLVVHQFE